MFKKKKQKGGEENRKEGTEKKRKGHAGREGREKLGKIKSQEELLIPQRRLTLEGFTKHLFLDSLRLHTAWYLRINLGQG